MREILFRGFAPMPTGVNEICLNGEKIKGKWVYGDLIHRKYMDDEITYFIRTEYSDFDNYVDYEIFSKTVGQYTGLTDKNGTKVFEGDILQAYLDDDFPDDVTTICILWEECGFEYIERGELIVGELDGEMMKLFEVVGNVTDNPELLEEE